MPKNRQFARGYGPVTVVDSNKGHYIENQLKINEEKKEPPCQLEGMRGCEWGGVPSFWEGWGWKMRGKRWGLLSGGTGWEIPERRHATNPSPPLPLLFSVGGAWRAGWAGPGAKAVCCLLRNAWSSSASTSKSFATG